MNEIGLGDELVFSQNVYFCHIIKDIPIHIDFIFKRKKKNRKTTTKKPLTHNPKIWYLEHLLIAFCHVGVLVCKFLKWSHFIYMDIYFLHIFIKIYVNEYIIFHILTPSFITALE